LKISGVAQKV